MLEMVVGLFSLKSATRAGKLCGKCKWFKTGTWDNCPSLGVCQQYAHKLAANPKLPSRDKVKIVFNDDLGCSAFAKRAD